MCEFLFGLIQYPFKVMVKVDFVAGCMACLWSLVTDLCSLHMD